MGLTTFLIAVAGIIATGSLSKVGANITDSEFGANITNLLPSQLRKLLSPNNREHSQNTSEIYCPFCPTIITEGQEVCLGCKAEVVYGGTKHELEESFGLGGLVGVFLSVLLLKVLPDWLNSKFSWNITSGFGLGIWAVTLGGVFAFVMGIVFVKVEEKRHRKKPPRCVHNGKIKYIKMLESDNQYN